MIVGRSFSTTVDTALVINAVNMAAQERIRWEATILHADHGPQFTSWGFGENLRRWGCWSLSGRSVIAFDNAVMEAFWGRLQTELLKTKKWSTTLELTAAMADHIDNFHNAKRRHSYLGNISPIEYEKLWADIQPYPQLS